MIPTIFTGLAVCVMFSANQFNLAAEGCVLVGGFVGALVGIYVIWRQVGTPLSVCSRDRRLWLDHVDSVHLKVKLGASEMVTSLMLNFVLLYIVLHFLNYHFADRSKGATMTYPFLDSAKISSIVPGNSKLTWGFVIALVISFVIWVFMSSASVVR